jgi:hypothetical protein
VALYSLPCTIAAGEAISSGVDCTGSSLVRILMPSAWDAAPLSFLMSSDHVNYYDLYHVQVATGIFQPYEVVCPMVVPNSAYAMPASTGIALAWIQLRSGTQSLPVALQADRTFQIVLAGA